MTAPFPSGHLLQQPGLEQGVGPEVAKSSGRRGEGQSLETCNGRALAVYSIWLCAGRKSAMI